MTGIAWKDEYSVGIIEFDADHKRLIALINALDEARGLKRDKTVILGAIQELMAYTEGHFRREEILMRRAHYPGYESHLEKHNHLRKKIVELHDAVEVGDIKEIEDDIMKFLYNWLIYHILNDDKMYCSFFSYHGYTSFFDEPTGRNRSFLASLSIRVLSNLTLALILIVTLTTIAAGGLFFNGVAEVRSFYDESAPQAIRRLRLADFLYSRFLPDAAFGGVFTNRGGETPTHAYDDAALRVAFEQVDEAVYLYGNLSPSIRERALLDAILAVSADIRGRRPDQPIPEEAAHRLGRMWNTVTELNSVAFDRAQEAERGVRSRFETLTSVVRGVAAINGGLIILLGVYWAWFSRVRLVRPLGVVTHAISRLASGDVDADVPAMGRSDEIGRLVDAFKILRRSALDRNWAQREQERLSEHVTWRRANRDPVTGLLNRTLFNDRLDHTLTMARRGKRRFALMFIDLDLFKRVNDTLGHDAGDELLCGVAQRLTECVRESDTVARLGGDEFGVIMSETGDLVGVVQAARRILETLQQPFILTKGTAHIGASIGIALFPDDGDDPATLVANADAAMYKAKQAGRNAYRIHGDKDVDETLLLAAEA